MDESTVTYHVVFSDDYEYGHLYRSPIHDNGEILWHYFDVNTQDWNPTDARDVDLEDAYEDKPLKFESFSEAIVAIVETCAKRKWHRETELWLRVL